MATTTSTTSSKSQHENKFDKAKDAMSGTADKAKDTASSFADKAKDTASNFADKAKDTAGNFADKAKDTAGDLMDKAKHTATDFGHKAEDATHSVGSGMKSFAGTIRENLPKEGMLGAAAGTVADGLETSGRYLEKEGLQGIAEDMTNMIRRNPIPALLVGIGVGFLIARATSTRS